MTFDVTIKSQIELKRSPVKNLAELIFNSLEHRPEDCEVILSHIGNDLTRISLEQMRYVVGGLYAEFERLGIRRGETMILSSLQGNNELYISIIFLALASYGVRVFLPMYMESEDLEEWVTQSRASRILIGKAEIEALKHQNEKKNALHRIIDRAESLGVELIDFRKEFGLDALLGEQSYNLHKFELWIEKTKKETTLQDEALIITTSGTSGKSKLVVHKQNSFVNSCLSWEAAGFYDKDLFGGRGFTPLFTHTMGIRAFFNAIWTGQPMCLIITDWFIEKPEVVAYLIRKMKPEHITGGPAVYNLFIELIRNFPELNEVAQGSFKCLVGSGAQFDEKFERKIKKQFGLVPFNAYGTTETQQTLSTVLNGANDRKGMGKPLPGVEVGLKLFDQEKGIYKLFIKAPMSCSSIINDKFSFTEDGYFKSGDLVKHDGEQIFYYGRENTDFIKDQFGVKIPIQSVKGYYSALVEKTSHIEYFSINDTPGLAAFIFISPELITANSNNSENQLRNELKGIISTANNDLLDKLEPFEFNHRSIKRARIIVVNTPLTAKGNPSRFQIIETFSNEIKELTDPMVSTPTIINLDDDFGYTDSYTRYNNPYIGQLLHTLGLDHHFYKADGNYLYTSVQGKEHRILDLTGGYGTNLLGHNHPALKKAMSAFLQKDQVAISDQGSIQNHPGELAKKLSIKLGKLTNKNFIVMFGNSGSEAVEMALHHALLAWKRTIEKIRDTQFQIYGGSCSELIAAVWESNQEIINSARCSVLALRNGFHGNSTGARSVLGNDAKRLLFKNLTNVEPLFIDDQAANWHELLEQYMMNANIELERVEYQNGEYIRAKFTFSGIIAAIAEPVIGEGGVREVNQEFLRRLSESPVPLILDEIQCGLGRTGSFLASQGINAEYYLFGKALGGSLTKLSALCIDKRVFVKKFGEQYVSTFANGGLAARVGSEVLDVIEQEDISKRSHLIGEELQASIRSVLEEFPDVLSDIKGKGLMLGIYFQNFAENESLVLRNLYLNDKLGYIFSAYFFHTHRIRIFPTLSAPNVLRIEPSAYLEKGDITSFVDALRELCKIVRSEDTYELLAPLMEGDTFEDHHQMENKRYTTTLEQPEEDGKKVAFIAHYTHPVEDMKMTIPELNKASDTGIRILFNKMQVLLEMKPFLLYSQNLYEGKVNFNFIVVPLDSAQLERMHRTGKRTEAVHHIQEAVNMANKLGAEVVSLGAYTSIITNNGMTIVEPKGTKVITGNTLTVATGTKHIIDIANKSLPPSPKTVAVIGAGGNIGSAVTETLIKSDLQIEQLVLIGRNVRKLERTLDQLNQLNDLPSTVISSEFNQLKECDLIIIATNTSDPIVFDHQLSKTRNVLISDVSVPSAVHKKVHEMDNVRYLPFTSFIKLPYDSNFVMSSVTPKGTTFCCAAEAILCGLEANDIQLKGNIPQEAIEKISILAEANGMFNDVHSIESFKEHKTT